MRALVDVEGTLLAYVRGVLGFDAVASAVRESVRVYAARRALRWSACPALADDLAQTMMVELWRSLDEFDPASGAAVSAWCGARMEFAMRRFLRGVGRDKTRFAYVERDVELDPETVYARLEVELAIRTIRDGGVVAYALGAMEAGDDVVSCLAMDDGLLRTLGWSDVALGAHAARRRARRNAVINELVGGVR